MCTRQLVIALSVWHMQGPALYGLRRKLKNARPKVWRAYEPTRMLKCAVLWTCVGVSTHAQLRRQSGIRDDSCEVRLPVLRCPFSCVRAGVSLVPALTRQLWYQSYQDPMRYYAK